MQSPWKWLAALGTGAVLAVAACEKAVAPDPDANKQPPAPLVVTVKLDSIITELSPIDTIPAIRCVFFLTANATGGISGQRGPWGTARLLLAAGTNRSTPIDSSFFTADNVSLGFGGDLLTGQTGRANVSFIAPFPYSLTMDFRYREAAESTTVKTVTPIKADCGKVPESGAAPVVGPRTITPTPNTFTGDTLTVAWTATSEVGLWASLLEFEGPCELPERLVFEKYLKSSPRTLKVPIPLACPPGTSFNVTVRTVDYLLREDSAKSTGPLLKGKRDSLPPKIRVVTDRRDEGPNLSFFLPGDLYRVDIDVTDSAGLGGRPVIGFRLGTVAKDSQPGQVLEIPPRSGGEMDTLYTRNFQRLAQAAWAGEQTLHAFARDASGNVSDTVVRVQTFLAPTSHTIRNGTLPPIQVRDWVYDAKRGKLLIAGSTAADCIIAVTTSTMAVAPSIPCPTAPMSLDLTEGGDSLVYILSGDDTHLAIRNLVTGDTSRVATSVDPGFTHDLSYVRALSAGRILVTHTNVSNTGDADGVFVFTPGGSVTDLQGDLPSLHGMILGRSLNHREALIGNGFANRVLHENGTLSPLNQLEWGSLHIWGVTADSTGSRFAFYSQVHDGDGQKVFSLPAPTNYQYNGNTISADGKFLYSTFDAGFLRSRLSDGKIVEYSPTTFGPARILITPDGLTLFAVGDNGLSAVDLGH